MFFRIVVYIIIAMGVLGAGFLLFVLYQNFIHKYIKRFIFKEEDYESLPDDEKYRRYLEKKQREIIKQQLVVRDHESGLIEYNNDVKIIAMMQPVGRWTKMVMGEHLQKLSGMKFNNKKNGFWQMIVSMKGMSQGKHKGRGR